MKFKQFSRQKILGLSHKFHFPKSFNIFTKFKLLACLLMVIDHIGAVFFPQLIILRIVGRLSFPLFAYLFAKGYQNTRTHLDYFIRLLLFGAIAQVPYYYLFGWKLNIILTFAYNLALLRLIHCIKSSPIKLITLIAGMVVASWLQFDYGWYATAIILLLIAYDQQCKGKWGLMWIGYWSVIHAFSWLVFSYQPVALFAVALLPAHNTKAPLSKPSLWVKYGFYAFYPLHLLLLMLAKKIIS